MASGGAGFDYGRIDTPFGTKDRLSSLFGIVRASVGGGMQVTDRLALGASIGLSYSRLNQESFPNPSVIGPSGPFFGTRIENAWAYGAGFRLGVHWRPLDRLAFSLTYSSKVDLPVEDGRIDVDMTSASAGACSPSPGRRPAVRPAGRLRHVVAVGSVDLAEGALEVGEPVGAEHLDARIVLAVERGHDGGAAIPRGIRG